MSDDASSFVALSPEDAARFAWTRHGPAARVVAALEASEPGSARYVGGCVRDTLLGATPKDIDVATTLAPRAVAAALKKAGLKSAPTGIAHGTVTAIADHVGVEVTTLRADVSTDGRRATVAFTKDWAVDARRRDFTLNAMYLTADGRLYDPVGGLADARAGRVRFIGAAADRIAEDYLRILRFFRFSARFAQGFDAAGLAACAAQRAGIARLSAERVGDETGKILAHPRAALAVAAMAETGVLAEIWNAPPDLAALAALKNALPDAPAPLCLAALWGEAGEGIDAALRLSNADSGRRRRALSAEKMISLQMTPREARAAMHRVGREAFLDGLHLAAARAGIPPPAALGAVVPPPPFPLSGRDLVAAGVAPGPEIARLLAALEEAWIAEDFPPEARVRAMLAERLAG